MYDGEHTPVIHEKFSKRDVKYLRLDFHVTVDNETYGREREIEIKYDLSDYDVVVPQFISMMKEHLTSVDREYATLNDYYRKIVLPRIVGEQKFPDVGADWMFEFLTATYLLDRENYPKLKKQI